MRRTRRAQEHRHLNVRLNPYRRGLLSRQSGACGLRRGDANRIRCRSESFREALLLEIKASEVHVGRAGDFKIALGAEDYEDVVTETFNQRRFIGGGNAILLCFAEGIAQKSV